MPARIARSSVQLAAPKNARNKNRKRNLDAYAIAAHEAPDKHRIRATRLGEVLDDGPKQKRRRSIDNDEDEESVDEDEARGPKRRRPGVNDDDGVEQGSDSEGNEWTLGGLASGDEDSDLDSDEAFGESDDEKFEGFTFRGSSSAKPKPSRKPKTPSRVAERNNGIDIDEPESGDEEDGDDFGEDGVDLATMLDDDDEEEGLDGKKDILGDDGGQSGSEEDDDEEDSASDSEPSAEEDDDDDEADEERVARLRDRLEALDKSDQVALPSAAQPLSISVDDLLADLDPSARKQFAAAIKTKKRSEAPKTLSAPLPKRQQDRIEREAATKKAKEQLDRWRDTVIHNRRADFLSFPLKDPDAADRVGTDKFVVDNAPKSQLEENIRKIMEESGMASKTTDGKAMDEESALLKAEELATNKLPVEEVMRRRAELRKSRDLLFREEIKAKRIAKIKSKSYRRVHRRERERQSELEREARVAAGLDPMEEDEQEAADRRRAEERMSTKHKSSKWAKSLKATNRTVWDEDARDSVMEEARRNEELRRRVAGENINDSERSDVSSDEDDDEDFEGDENAQLARRLDRLNTAKKEGDGLSSLKFMRAADDRRRKQNDEDIERLRKELAIENGDENDSDGQIDDQGLGRAIFGPGPKTKQDSIKQTKRPELEEGDLSDDGFSVEAPPPAIETDTTGAKRSLPAFGKRTAASGPLARAAAGQVDSTNTGASQEQSAWIAGPTQAPHAKEGDWLSSRTKSKKDQRRTRATNDVATLNLDLSSDKKGRDPVLPKSAADSGAKLGGVDTAAGNTDGWTVVKYTDDDDDANESDASSSKAAPTLSKKPSYHARAFAGDDVEAAFQAEKDEAIASEDEKEVNNHLPGWGSWTGEGLSKGVRKANAKQAHNPLWKHKLAGIKAADRKDAKLANVIISEKKDAKGAGKKSAKYLATALPHEFEKREQYERSLRMPVGPEWTTKETFQKTTRPRVVVKPGSVIEAMKKPLM